MEGKVIPAGFTEPKKKHHKPIPKLVFIAVVAIAILLSIAAISLIFGESTNKSNTAFSTNQCNGNPASPIYKEISLVLDQNASTTLIPVVTKIKSMKNYDNDPSCLYPLVIYHMNIGDVVSARTYFDKLKQNYDPKKGFVKTLGSKVVTIEELEGELKYSEILYKEILILNKVPGIKR